MLIRRSVAVLMVGMLLSAAAPPKPKPDLADAAQGQYHGNVMSDARGPSQSDVAVTVTKVGPNQVSVTADYERIPPRTFKLTKAMSTIQSASGSEVFLLQLDKSPVQLMLTIDDAAWAGTRE
jgi:hypothetical protein